MALKLAWHENCAEKEKDLIALHTRERTTLAEHCGDDYSSLGGGGDK